MTIVGVVYMSRSAWAMLLDDLDWLLLDARTHNVLVHITGVLLYGDGQFFQYFESNANAVATVYERIRRSSLHAELVELERRETPEALFRKWFIGFRMVPTSALPKLSQAHWELELPWAEDHAMASVGM